jgi:hypothetical protein
MMELLTLDANYQPAELIERYNSLLWTERYVDTGDFQLVTSDIERMLALLPLESCVTIRESTVPMLVEARKIQKDSKGVPLLTVTGRSFESVLERRAAAMTAVAGGPRVAWIEEREEPSDAAYHAIRKTIGDTKSRVRTLLPAVNLAPISPMNSPLDVLPMVDQPLPADYSPGTSNKFEIKPGNLYTTVIELVNVNHHGIKAVRPELGSNQVTIEIVNGADLTHEVVFDAKFDQFDDATYLLSYMGSTNKAYVYSKTSNSQIDKNTYAVPSDEPNGLKRRVLYLDISSEEGTDSPEARRIRGLMELYKYNATALFDGAVAQQVETGYNRDYFLGDIIRLDGEYGLSENVRVSEFIRSDDNTGSKAYPTFEMVASNDTSGGPESVFRN